MFRITRLTDYGILMMAQFARNPELHMNASGLARAVQLPLPTVSKVLQLLLREGLLVSVRGARGGYRLAKQPANINVREMIEALEGPIALTECSLNDDGCEHDSCLTRDVWQRINHVVGDALAGVSLADAIDGAQPVLLHEHRVSMESES